MRYRKTRLAVGAVLACMGSAALAQEAASARPTEALLAQAEPATLSYTDDARSSGWIPFTLFDGVRMFFPATINGRQVEVMLDSGAEVTVLDERFVSELGLRSVGDLTAQGAGGSGQYGIVDGVQIGLGALSISNSRTVGVDLSQIEKAIGHPLPIVLGGAALDHTVIEIDYRNRRVAFHDPKQFKRPDGMHAHRLFDAGGNRAIDVQIEGRTARMVFDIGNAWPALLYPRFWQAEGFMDGRMVSTTMTGGFGGMQQAHMSRLRELRVGGVAFKQLPVPMTSERVMHASAQGLDGNLGMPVVSRFHVIIDFPQQQVLFGAPFDLDVPFKSNLVGVSMSVNDGRGRVSFVAQGSPAEQAGLRVGDVVTAISEQGSDVLLPLTGTFATARSGQRFALRLDDGRELALEARAYY